MLNVDKIRKDFKVLNGEKAPVYFDSACMSLKPDCVVRVMTEYYEKYPACGFRSSHRMSSEVTKRAKEVRKIIAKFINTKNENEIIFTRNTTEGINLLANSFDFQKGDKVLISDKEHNSNLVPWLYLRDKIGVEVIVVPSKEDNTFDLERFSQLVSGAKFVSMVHTSNLDGVINPIKDIVQIAHKAGALVLVDAAQGILHSKIDVRELDVDFLVFSGHKILGPTGTGVLYGKKELLEKLNPFLVGGDTVEYSTYEDYKMLDVPEKFEAGLQDFAGILGLGSAIEYLDGLSYEDIKEHEYKLNKMLTDALSKFSQIKIIGPTDPSLRSGIVTFYIPGKDMHQFSVMLDEMKDIATRTGQLCVHSWFNSRKIINATRVSLSVYNTKEEMQIFIDTLEKIIKII